MKKYFDKIIHLIIFTALSAPVFVRAMWNPSQPIVPCGRGDTECHFADLIVGVSNIIDFFIYVAAPIAAAMFAYAGFLYLLSGGSVDKRKKANSIFTNVGIGLVFVVGAWLIVKLVVAGLGAEDSSYLNL